LRHQLINSKRLVFERVEVPIRDLPDPFDGYRIAILADLHYPRWTDRQFVRKSIALANEFKPDLIALPGDICDPARHRSKSIPSLSGLMDGASAPDGIVGVLGNHDHWFDADALRRELSDNTPIKLIENTCIYVQRAGDRIAVGGVGDLWHGVVDPERAFAGVPHEMPRILLSHNPDLAERMKSDVRVDLQLSGHTHGGQVCFPSGTALRVPSLYGNKFRAGLVQGKHHRVYVSRGVASQLHLRLFCPPEVTGITLRKSSEP